MNWVSGKKRRMIEMCEKKKVVLMGLIIALSSMGNPLLAIISYNSLQSPTRKEAVRDE